MHVPLSPYLLLVLTTLFWSGNFVLGRAVHFDIPPISLVFWRWTGALLILLPFSWRHLKDQWPLLLTNWKYLFIFGFLGVTCFNTFIYIALQSTTATNAVLINSIIPVLIVVLSWAFGGIRITRRQALGMAVSFAGVINIVCRADIGQLLALQLNRGDIWVLLAVVSWAVYTFLLRKRPAGLHPLSFLTSLIMIGLIVLAPLYGWELSQGYRIVATSSAFFSLCYVALFPSVLAFIFWNQAVGQVGSNKAGLFLHLMPVFGTILSIILLGEVFHLYQLAGIVLIFTGIYLTTAR